jgi:hypothetical protein
MIDKTRPRIRPAKAMDAELHKPPGRAGKKHGGRPETLKGVDFMDENELMTFPDLSAGEKALILTLRNGNENVKKRILSLLGHAGEVPLRASRPTGAGKETDTTSGDRGNVLESKKKLKKEF